MYDRTIDGQEYTFGVSGKLIRNVLVMFDHETDSLWSQLLGQAVDGPMAGTKLQPLPAVQTTWAQWKSLHPDTLALVTGGPVYDSYDGYYTSGQAGVIGETFSDTRLPRKELVHGVLVEGQPVAYPFSELRTQRAVNDTVNGIPILVLFHVETATALAFHRTVADQVLTFAPSPDDSLIFVDHETGSRWMALTGAAIGGPLKGKRLERIPGTSSFWFGWKDFYTNTLVYGR